MDSQFQNMQRVASILNLALHNQPHLESKIDEFHRNLTKTKLSSNQHYEGQNPFLQSESNQQGNSTAQSDNTISLQPIQNHNFIKDEILQVNQVYRMGSLSNQVYKVQLKNGHCIIAKGYYDTLKQFVHRDIQHSILDQMTVKNEYPFVFYKDTYCRVQAYIPGRVISRKQLGLPLLKKITLSLAKFSQEYENCAIAKLQSDSRQIQKLFKTFQTIYTLKSTSSTNAKQLQLVKQYVEELLLKQEVLKNLKTILHNHKMNMNHNDTNLSNFLIVEFPNQEKVQLLDFQFSNMNYIGFDLGNFLNEVSTDYGGAYQIDSQGKQHSFEIRSDWQLPQESVRIMTNIYFDQIEDQSNYSSYHYRSRCVKIGRLLSHLYWLFVGLKQIDDPHVDLDMSYYIRRRYEQFTKLFQKMLSQ